MNAIVTQLNYRVGLVTRMSLRTRYAYTSNIQTEETGHALNIVHESARATHSPLQDFSIYVPRLGRGRSKHRFALEE
jgi:hypothetical protein